jgi:uncharacterized protein Usg
MFFVLFSILYQMDISPFVNQAFIYHNFDDCYQNLYNFITYCHNFIEFKYESINQKTRDLLIANQWSATGSPGTGSTIFVAVKILRE